MVKPLRITGVTATVVNVPFVAPIRWSGGANADWSRVIVEMTTDAGLTGLGETLGGSVTKALIDTEIAPMFLGENPFDVERMLSKATFVPLYYGKCGHCAVAGLELACYDLMGKATELPLCRLIGGRLREEIPFAAYVYHRNADRQGRHAVDTLDEVVARAEALVGRMASARSNTRAGSRAPKKRSQFSRRSGRGFRR